MTQMDADEEINLTKVKSNLRKVNEKNLKED